MMLASDAEILRLLQYLEGAFKNHKYSDIQRRIISRNFKLVSFDEGIRLIESLAMAGNLAPAPNKLMESIRETQRKRTGRPKEDEYIHPLECHQCFETGHNFVIIDGVQTLCRCRCKFGRSEAHRALPLFDTRMTLVDFPKDKFKPSQKELASKPPNQWETVRWWTGQKQIALEYWKSKNNGGVA